MTVVSVVIPTRSLEEGEQAVRRIPSGADEILIVGFGVKTAPGHARNLGARYATGDVLLFVDDDVELRGDLSWFASRPRSEEWWSAAVYRDATRNRDSAVMAAWWSWAGHFGLWTATVGAFIGCRRSLFNRVGGFPPRYIGEDAGIGEAFYRAGAKLVIAPVAVSLLRPSPFATTAFVRDNPKYLELPRPAELPFKRFVPA